RIVVLGLLGDRRAQELVAARVVALDQRVAVVLDGAQAAQPRPPAPGEREAGRARQLCGHAILQREQLARRAVDLGAADDLAGLDVDEARGEPHARAGALVRA